MTDGASGKTNGGGRLGDLGGADPFSSGVWVLTAIDGAAAVALVVGSEGKEEEVQRDMVDQQERRGFICVDLRRKTLLKEVCFPLPERTSGGQMTGRLMPGSLPSACRHEITLEMTEDFVTHMTLHQLTFVDEMPAANVEKLRESVVNAERSAADTARLIRSNLVSPSHGMGL